MDLKFEEQESSNQDSNITLRVMEIEEEEANHGDAKRSGENKGGAMAEHSFSVYEGSILGDDGSAVEDQNRGGSMAGAYVRAATTGGKTRRKVVASTVGAVKVDMRVGGRFLTFVDCRNPLSAVMGGAAAKPLVKPSITLTMSFIKTIDNKDGDAKDECSASGSVGVLYRDLANNNYERRRVQARDGYDNTFAFSPITAKPPPFQAAVLPWNRMEEAPVLELNEEEDDSGGDHRRAATRGVQRSYGGGEGLWTEHKEDPTGKWMYEDAAFRLGLILGFTEKC